MQKNHHLPITLCTRTLMTVAAFLLLAMLQPITGSAQTFRVNPNLILPDFSGQSEHQGRNPMISAALENMRDYTESLQNDLSLFCGSVNRLETFSRAMTPKNPLFEKAAKENAISSPGEIWRVMNAWLHYLHYIGRLEHLACKYHFSMTDLWKDDGKAAFEAYFLGINAKLALMVHTSKLMQYLRARPKLAKLFDEPYPPMKLPRGMLQNLAQSCIRPRNLLSLYTFHLTHLDDMRRFYRGKGKSPIVADSAGLLKAYYDRHHELVDRLMKRIAKDSTWYKFALGKPISDALGQVVAPMQKEIFTWVGDTRVKHKNDYLIKEHMLPEMHKRMRPGDLIVERRNWFLSNLFITGFWPHAALYVGTPVEVAANFDQDPDVREYFRRKDADGLTDYLKKTFPEAYKSWTSPNTVDGKTNVVLEAISEGVVFNSIEESCCADYVGVMRTRLTPLDVAKALVNAFSLYGREYDFDFDFSSESEFVCTELVTKAYAPEQGKRGILFPWSTALTGKVVRANDIVRKFDHEFGKNNQDLDFVYFLKGIEPQRRAEPGTVEEFRRSHGWQGKLGGQ